MRFKVRRRGIIFRIRSIPRDFLDFDEETRKRIVTSRNRSPSVPYGGPYLGRTGGWRRS